MRKASRSCSTRREFALDLHQVAEIWRDGSVVRSWLLDLTADALGKNPTHGRHRAVRGRFRRRSLDGRRSDRPRRAGAGDHASLLERLRSRDADSFADKLLAAMRNEFGGHAIKKE